MPKMLAKRPSPALVVAFVALFVALSGVGYTAAKLNGKRLKSRSVSGKKLKLDTVTGKEAKESTFGQVPSAATLGGTAASGFGKPVRWALVNNSTATPTIAKQSGGITVDQSIPGFYYLDFGSAIGNRGVIASLAGGTAEVSAGACSDPVVACNPTFNTPQTVQVTTGLSSTGAPTALSFYVALLP